MEFLAIGSSVKTPAESGPFFSTACSGQDLFCQIDSGYEPRHFVIGNVAYALGIARGITGGLKILARRGEVKEFSDMYNHTRHLALERLEAEAAERGCNAVVDIITRIIPFGPGRPRDADGRHRLVQPGAGAAQGALHLGADRRGALEPHPARLRPAPPAAGDERLRPGLRRRVHGVLPVVRPGRDRRGHPTGLRRPRELPRPHPPRGRGAEGRRRDRREDLHQRAGRRARRGDGHRHGHPQARRASRRRASSSSRRPSSATATRSSTRPRPCRACRSRGISTATDRPLPAEREGLAPRGAGPAGAAPGSSRSALRHPVCYGRTAATRKPMWS